ncbi:putative 2-keto-3-deoxy-galactonate aldolase YagE [Polystyrenella longa]|uniref:Putative 2-keto-3-deoxy-galactonate aldolase YagE n=1 Tax=Polystyrenella longa TaxID=2528007 RepID=A0A518CRW1_9PLAN|nr:dihydrodipicolinate synthase family protein [Polystyrenella longa]QDU81966.1 putative 2-keto-3-deoxy-galactonate aldolase YagE [Polystyrenella longa]
MTDSKLPKPLSGIIPPMITPLKDRNTLDIEGLERLVEHIIAGGVHGLFVLGTTGEAPSLSYQLRQEVLERTCNLVKGRIPVIVGITDTSYVESVNLAEFAADCGADAVVLAAPYYFPAGQPELLEYVTHIAPELPLPMYLYNMPSLTKVTFDPSMVKQALDIPNVIGLKDSSGNMIYLHEIIQICKDRPDFTLLVGPEQLLAESVLMGGHGGINGGANLAPKLYVDLYNAAKAEDMATVRKLHNQVMELAMSIYTVGKHGSTYLKGLKCALSCAGICSDMLAEPFTNFKDAERAQVNSALEKLGLLSDKASC